MCLYVEIAKNISSWRFWAASCCFQREINLLNNTLSERLGTDHVFFDKLACLSRLTHYNDNSTMWIFRRIFNGSWALSFCIIENNKVGFIVISNHNTKDVRELIFQSYRIIYLHQSDHVYITVINGSRDLTDMENQSWDVE